jgi:hypothetical protein
MQYHEDFQSCFSAGCYGSSDRSNVCASTELWITKRRCFRKYGSAKNFSRLTIAATVDGNSSCLNESIWTTRLDIFESKLWTVFTLLKRKLRDGKLHDWQLRNGQLLDRKLPEWQLR